MYALVTRRKAPSGGVGVGGGGPLQSVEIKIHLMLREFPLKQTNTKHKTQNTKYKYIYMPTFRTCFPSKQCYYGFSKCIHVSVLFSLLIMYVE